MAGPFFELYIQKRMKGSVVLVMRRLLRGKTNTDEEETTITCGVPMLQVATDVFPWTEDRAVWPECLTFPAIDMAIAAQKLLFQVTVSLKHKLHVRGMVGHLNNVGATAENKAKLIVLTRKAEFRSMTAMPFTDKGNTDMDAFTERFEQWVAYIK
jgi:hypothetical protein